MTSRDQKIIFNALGFLAVILKGTETNQEESAEQARKLARLMEEFCEDNVPAAYAVSDEA